MTLVWLMGRRGRVAPGSAGEVIAGTDGVGRTSATRTGLKSPEAKRHLIG